MRNIQTYKYLLKFKSLKSKLFLKQLFLKQLLKYLVRIKFDLCVLITLYILYYRWLSLYKFRKIILKNICLISLRRRAVFTKFMVSRFVFRKLMFSGKLYGYRKSSW